MIEINGKNSSISKQGYFGILASKQPGLTLMMHDAGCKMQFRVG